MMNSSRVVPNNVFLTSHFITFQCKLVLFCDTQLYNHTFPVYNKADKLKIFYSFSAKTKDSPKSRNDSQTASREV